MEFGGNVEGQRLVRCVDRGAWMRRAGRACAAGEISSRPHFVWRKDDDALERGRAEGRWSGVPGWRDDAMR